ncbi:hypothetical protein [Streptacidiphilus neutrinimicus]|uniref:hypothetical protein n=1 Tax=Streptacidiphilus neutrinimicus TaxID=105420 RepID=UPI000AB6AA02|nr:hypothetical protein [Streptacidiphilus neutrinimicus]
MRYFAKLRRPTAIVALAVLAVGAAIGIARAVQDDPIDTGGLAPPHAVAGADHRAR